MKTLKLMLFWILVTVQTLFALPIFYNDFMSIFNMVPGGNYPIEHRLSFIVVLLFCCGAIASCYLMWFFTVKNKRAASLPSPVLVLLLAGLVTTLSAIYSHYLSMKGWCCESPFTFYFGFPFSFLEGIGGFDYKMMISHRNDSLLKILLTSQPQVGWHFVPYHFFLDFLFWSNALLVLFIKGKYDPKLVEPFRE